MRPEIFINTVEKIYANFGKPLPKNEALTSVFNQHLAKIPDRLEIKFTDFCYGQSMNLSALPQNFGKMFRDYWYEFKRQNEHLLQNVKK